jgi:hypothetical protein
VLATVLAPPHGFFCWTLCRCRNPGQVQPRREAGRDIDVSDQLAAEKW